MPLRFLLAPSQFKHVLTASTLLIALDWQFRFVSAPLILLIALLGASFFEGVTSYRCCSEGEKFKFRSVAWEKAETVAVVLAGGCMDAALYVLGRLASPLFPVFAEVNIPIVFITFAFWMIYAEVNESRSNLGKLRGRKFLTPFPGGVSEFIDTLKRADTVHPARRRRRTDRIIDAAAKKTTGGSDS